MPPPRKLQKVNTLECGDERVGAGMDEVTIEGKGGEWEWRKEDWS